MKMLLIFFTLIALVFVVTSCPEKKKIPPTPKAPEPQVSSDLETSVTLAE